MAIQERQYPKLIEVITYTRRVKTYLGLLFGPHFARSVTGKLPTGLRHEVQRRRR